MNRIALKCKYNFKFEASFWIEYKWNPFCELWLGLISYKLILSFLMNLKYEPFRSLVIEYIFSNKLQQHRE
jgi:hypothetical protein